MKWLWTALVTPFTTGNWLDNEIDYEALEKILDMQIEWKVDWVLLLGTTSEIPTLTQEEQIKIVKFALKKLLWKTKIMVNIWTYSTQGSIKNIKIFDEIVWIDAYLVVNPYYNKPTQSGLFQHFTAIAHSTQRDIILYNIEWRTWVNLKTDTLLAILEESKNIIWIKEASGKIQQVQEVLAQTPSDFLVFSGEEWLSYELIQSGGHGVISVASNCVPSMMKEFIDSCLLQNEKSEQLQKKYIAFFDALFIQTNPLPAKTFLADRGIIQEEFRLPLCKMNNDEKEKFLKISEKY